MIFDTDKRASFHQLYYCTRVQPIYLSISRSGYVEITKCWKTGKALESRIDENNFGVSDYQFSITAYANARALLRREGQSNSEIPHSTCQGADVKTDSETEQPSCWKGKSIKMWEMCACRCSACSEQLTSAYLHEKKLPESTRTSLKSIYIFYWHWSFVFIQHNIYYFILYPRYIRNCPY